MAININNPSDVNKLAEFARRKKELPAWREFKTKWNGKHPRKNSNLFIEYAADATVTNAACQKLANEIFAD